MIKTNKCKARKLFNSGGDVYLLPNKVRVDNCWMTPLRINRYIVSTDFDNFVNDYTYFNCNYELGYYCAYYIADTPGVIK